MFRYSDYDASPFESSLPSPDCTLVAPLLTAYFDLEATGTEAARVQRHLSDCAHCAQMWRDWGDARLVLQTTPTPAPPYTLAAEIVQTSRLVALLPAAPLTEEFGLANRQQQTVVPAQLHEAILAATTRAPISHKDTIMNDAVLLQRDFPRSLRRAKPLVAMSLVPTLALWLITLTASNSTFFAPSLSRQPATAPSAIISAPAMSQMSGLKAADLRIASPKDVTTQPLNSLPQKPVLPRAVETPETTPALALEGTNIVASQIPETGANYVTLAQWSPSKTVASGIGATPMSTYSPPPSVPVSSATPKIALRATVGKTVKVATVAHNTRVTRTAALPQAQRRIAKLSTVSMTTPAALAESMPPAKVNDEAPGGDSMRVVMKLEAPDTQKAMLPVAASRETNDESLWKSDVATAGSALSVVQALNDNRPRELRDAFDAYAKTLIDDSEAATL